MSPTLAQLHIGDDPQLWVDLGFTVVDRRCRLGGVELVLTGPDGGHGIHGWSWSGVAGEPAVGDIPTTTVDTTVVDNTVIDNTGPADGVRHRNGAIGLYYVVLFGPSWAEAAEALTGLGLDPGQGRPMGSSEQLMLRSLADAGDVEIEVIGPAEPDPARRWRLWGTIVEVADLPATADALGDRVRPMKQAIQPGRRIATLDRSAGSSVAIAFMGPDER